MNKKNKCAIYSRTSSDDTFGHKRQIEKCERYAKLMHISIEDIYKDSGFAQNKGNSTLNSILEAGKSRKFDELLIIGPDRLSRNFNELNNIITKFQRYGIIVRLINNLG